MIERIQVQAVAPEVEPLRWASDLPAQNATLTIVRVFDDEGQEGVGATPSYSTGGFDLVILESLRAVVPRVVGHDPLMREGIWHRLNDLVLPVLPGAYAAIDIALWDIVARRAGIPLYQLLGGVRQRIPAYASTPMLADAEAYVAFCHELRSMGFRAIKFHAWCEPDRDLQMLRAVHAEHGDAGLVFMHDAEQRYDRPSALRVAQELGDMGFGWLEAPLVDGDLHGYRELRRRVNLPIIPAGNTIIGLQQVSDALQFEPWDAVRFDVTIAGGLTPARKLAALAEAWGLHTELQSWGYSLIQAPNLHFGLAFERTGYFELPVPYEVFDYAVNNSFRVDGDGCVSAPGAPGLGLEVDWERMDHATISSFSCVVESSDTA
jgi:L-alanine-DL-glutamate epimerase-like enolase superfamily enzyme